MSAAPRLPVVDAARGFAVAMMIVFHFCYDLTHFGFAQFNMLSDPGWIAWRNGIVSTFLAVAGLSLVLAAESGSKRGFVSRLAQIGGCALLISLASWWMFGPRWIYFGILHFVLAATLLAQPLLRLRLAALPLGLAVIAAGVLLQHPAMDTPWLDWIGMATRKPQTEDYVPLFPWFGVVLCAIGLASGWARHGWRQHATVAAAGNAAPRWLLWLGRHSLLVYMIHQPILMSLVGGARWLIGA